MLMFSIIVHITYNHYNYNCYKGLYYQHYQHSFFFSLQILFLCLLILSSDQGTL